MLRVERTARRLRWVGRGIGLFMVATWLLIGIAHATGESEPWTAESTWLVGLLCALTIGIAISWWRERPGAIAMTVCAIAFATFGYISAGHNRAFAAAISGGPFLLAGILLLLAWQISRR